jgi:hypothetical protein
MIRRLFTFLSALSLLLCVAMVVLWVRGTRRADTWDVGYFQPHPSPEYAGYVNGKKLLIVHYGGRLFVARQEVTCIGRPGEPLLAGPGHNGERWVHEEVERPEAESTVGQEVWFDKPPPPPILAGVRWLAESPPAPASIEVPDATMCLTFAMLPSTFALRSVVRRRRRNARRRRAECPLCGYDLRASPGRCPECGAVPAAKGAA